MTAYQELQRRFARIAHLDNALGILHWDQQTVMPAGAADARGETLAALSVMRHELLTDPWMAGRLDEAEADAAGGGLDGWQHANLREMRRIHTVETAVPADLVEANVVALSRCEMTWRGARRDNDFAALRPSLGELLRLQQHIGEARGAALGLSPYDALLEAYEPGGRADLIDPLFDQLADFLPGFTGEVLERQASGPPIVPPAGTFPVDRQRALSERLMRVIGFDFEQGRLDVSAHPFCGGADRDVRITTRYDEQDFTKSLMAVVHETGHALYEQGRPAAWRGQPVGEARSMSVHESQSLLVEMQACRSREFLDFAAPLMRDAFGGSGPAWEPDNLCRLYRRVVPGFIRVDADEVTYPAHVILRYRLERAMLSGDLSLDDLPAAWNHGMHTLLGVTPPTDALGCLQDIHWPSGSWGYFPTYTLGAMTAAQMFEAACAAEPAILPGLAGGDFVPLVAWLRRHVHEHGSRLGTTELVAEATGRPLDASVYRRYLERRYRDDA